MVQRYSFTDGGAVQVTYGPKEADPRSQGTDAIDPGIYKSEPAVPFYSANPPIVTVTPSDFSWLGVGANGNGAGATGHGTGNYQPFGVGAASSAYGGANDPARKPQPATLYVACCSENDAYTMNMKVKIDLREDSLEDIVEEFKDAWEKLKQ